MAAKSETYKGEPIRTNVLRLVLLVEIAVCAIVLAAVVAAGNSQLTFPEPWHTIYGYVVQTLRYLPLAAMICLMFWIFRANRNARALSPRALENSAGWAVGWFFVPIASLWKPYEVMREIYKASRAPHDWLTAKNTDIVGWWWGTYILGNAIGLAMKMFVAVHDVLFLRGMGVAAYIAMIIHQTLLLVIVGRIVKWQAAAHRQGGIENLF